VIWVGSREPLIDRSRIHTPIYRVEPYAPWEYYVVQDKDQNEDDSQRPNRRISRLPQSQFLVSAGGRICHFGLLYTIAVHRAKTIALFAALKKFVNHAVDRHRTSGKLRFRGQMTL
jgi:hypothetical protein